MPKKKAERKVNKRTPDLSCTSGSPDSPNNPKKKRRTSNTPAQAQGPPSTPPSNDLGPPPLTGSKLFLNDAFNICQRGYGDTIIASNPFDDMPHSNAPASNMNPGPGHGSLPHPQMPPMQQYVNSMNMKNMSMGGHMNNPMMASMSGGPMVPSGMMGPNGPGVPMNRGMGGPMGPLGGPMNGPGNGPMGSHMNGPMSGLMNMNGMNNMPCSMPMNSSMGNGGPGMTMNNMNSVNNISGMNGPMSNMPCHMNGPGVMNPGQVMQNGPSPNMGQKPMPVSSGKIYPSDQPMVFNPQNPNAPPIYPCGMCHKEVHDNDQAILCESGCNFWFHRVCTGLTETAYHQLTSEVYAEWVCDKCLGSKSIPLVKFKP